MAGWEFELPIGAVVRFSDTGQIQLRDDEGQEHWVSSRNAGKINVMHPSSVEGIQGHGEGTPLPLFDYCLFACLFVCLLVCLYVSQISWEH